MKRILVICAALAFLSNIISYAQAPDVVVSPKKYIENIGGSLKVSKNRKGKVGFTDANDRLYIPTVFDEATDFEHQLASKWMYLATVRYGDKWRIIKDNGEYFPDADTDFDARPEFINACVFCESDGQIYLHSLAEWGRKEPYDKLVFEDKTVYIPEKGSSASLYMIDPYGRERKYDEYSINVIETEGCHIIKDHTGYYLADHKFNTFTPGYSFMRGDGEYVVALNKAGDGVVYQNGVLREIRLTDINGRAGANASDLQHVLNGRQLLNFMMKNESSSQITTLRLWKKTGKWIYSVERDGLYGLADLSGDLLVPPVHDARISDVSKRYASADGQDIVVYKDAMYTVTDYENHVFSELAGSVRYDVAAECYFAAALLAPHEKIHYNDVVAGLEKWREEMYSLDDRLFSELGPQEYISTDRVPEDFKKYLDVAQIKVENNTKLIRDNTELIKVKEIHHERKVTDLREDIQAWNGNYYTHRVFNYNGLTFRTNAITEEKELNVNGFYLPLTMFNDNYSDYASIGRATLPDKSHLEVFTTDHNYQELGRSDTDGVLWYAGESSTVSMVKVDSIGTVTKPDHKSALAWEHLTIRHGYFYTNVVARRWNNDGDNDYDLDYRFLRRGDSRSEFYSNSSMKPVITRVNDFENEKSLLSLVYLFDYDKHFNEPLIYVSQEGDFVHDVIRWKDKWVLVGSTINNGYIDWENPYIVILDSHMNVLSSSYLALKGERVKIDHNTIYEDVDRSLVIPTWARISPNNTIKWLKEVN